MGVRTPLRAPSTHRRCRRRKALHDFANSGYTTVVLTAVFNAHFVGVVAGGADWGTLAWTLALGLSNLIVMFTMPALGANADLRAAKKRLLLLTTRGCVGATAGLAQVGPGDLAIAVTAIVLGNVCCAYGESLTAAFLPELARRDAIGRVSGRRLTPARQPQRPAA